jgi:hypothetical protein
MGKTQSQTLDISIKKEEEGDCKPSLCLYSANNTATNKITKRNPSRPLSAQQIKVEEDIDTKSLLKSESSSSSSASRPRISQEQINQLIHYIVNDNMSVTAAARKAKMSKCGGYSYYNIYKNDPEKRIPLLRDQTSKNYTQEQIENLIRYVNDDKMTVTEASAKVNLAYNSGRHYYSKYLKDPNRNIPVPQLQQSYTQDQKNEFFNYIINDKMSIKAASRKARVNLGTAQKYYYTYFKVQNPGIPAPSHIATHKCYTPEQIKEVISYIVHDKMSIRAASTKANMRRHAAEKHYRQYLKANNTEIPMGKYCKHYIQEEKDDKMSITTASKKVNMCGDTGFGYYRASLKDQKL